MRTEVERQTSEVVGADEEQIFTVKVGPDLMRDLSRLYSKQEEAIVREYLTNMGDAVIKLQQEDPVAEIIPCELHGPLSTDPCIRFKDYGCGMERMALMNVLTVYGASTKTRDNTQTGGKGYGAKSAFCYESGQHWSITSIRGGIKNVVFCSKDEFGVPKMSHILEEPTDEHSGTEVKIPVNFKDFNAFREAIYKYYRTFMWPLTVFNVDQTRLKKISYAFERKLWALRSARDNHDNYYRNEYPMEIIMGGVPYPVSGYTFPEILGVSNLNAFQRLELRAPVGSLSLPASREAIEWTDHSKKVIGQILKTALTELSEEINKMIATEPTLWDAAVKLHKLDIPKQYCPKTVEWKGQNVWNYISSVIHFDSILDFRTDAEKNGVRNEFLIWTTKSVDVRYEVRRAVKQKAEKAKILRWRKDDQDTKIVIAPAENLLVLVDDLPKRGALEQTKLYLDRIKSLEKLPWPDDKILAFLITPDPEGPPAVEIKTKLDEALKGIPVKLISEVFLKPEKKPKLPRIEGGDKKEDSATFTVQVRRNGYFASVNAPTGDGPFYYVKMEGSDIQGVSSYQLENLPLNLKRAKVLNMDNSIYCLGARNQKKIQDDSRWVDFVKVVAEKAKEANKLLLDKLNYPLIWQAKEYGILEWLWRNHLDMVAPGKLKTMLEGVMLLSTDSGVDTEVRAMRDVLYSIESLRSEFTDRNVEASEELSRIVSKYPILGAMCHMKERYSTSYMWIGQSNEFKQLILDEVSRTNRVRLINRV